MFFLLLHLHLQLPTKSTPEHWNLLVCSTVASISASGRTNANACRYHPGWKKWLLLLQRKRMIKVWQENAVGIIFQAQMFKFLPGLTILFFDIQTSKGLVTILPPVRSSIEKSWQHFMQLTISLLIEARKIIIRTPTGNLNNCKFLSGAVIQKTVANIAKANVNSLGERQWVGNKSPHGSYLQRET